MAIVDGSTRNLEDRRPLIVDNAPRCLTGTTMARAISYCVISLFQHAQDNDEDIYEGAASVVPVGALPLVLVPAIVV